jgi:hypothetical protein
VLHHIWVRTTLNLDDDVLRDVKQYAENRSVGLGKAISDLVRRGLNTPIQTKVINGIHVVVLPKDSPKITSERVKRLLEDEL